MNQVCFSFMTSVKHPEIIIPTKLISHYSIKCRVVDTRFSHSKSDFIICQLIAISSDQLHTFS